LEASIQYRGILQAYAFAGVCGSLASLVWRWSYGRSNGRYLAESLGASGFVVYCLLAHQSLLLLLLLLLLLRRLLIRFLLRLLLLCRLLLRRRLLLLPPSPPYPSGGYVASRL